QAADAHAIASDAAFAEAAKVKADPYSTDSQIHVALASEEAANQSKNALSITRAGFRDGEKTAEVQKGDVPGHPFHGNQYTDGTAGMASRAQEAVDNSGTREAAEIHDKLAEDHKTAAEDARKRYNDWGNPRGNKPEAQARRVAGKAAHSEMEALLKAKAWPHRKHQSRRTELLKWPPRWPLLPTRTGVGRVAARR
ncbi:MAG: hypothetical protein EBR81_15080, partial [Proteobacteria bacterium]|nr:hypothetical protein [Pseudomonadota bacterium]